jgi:hypothetical protein
MMTLPLLAQYNGDKQNFCCLTNSFIDGFNIGFPSALFLILKVAFEVVSGDPPYRIIDPGSTR